LNDHIKKEAERLFNELDDVHVMALDLYDGNVATTRDEAMTYIRQVDAARAEAIITGAGDFAGKDAKIATIGWCFGGGWSLQAAIISGMKTVGCVIYYGSPEKDVERLKALNSDVLGIFAIHDGGIGPDVVAEFEKNMVSAEKSVTVHSFDAAHAFANPSSPRYKEAAAQTANMLALDYLKRKFE
jgi:carboxymethylenebutenolidase